MSDGTLLHADRVTVTFGSGEDAFDAVHEASVRVGSGEMVGVVGESGSGKTTLARVLVGLQRPTAGTVALEGTTVVGPGTTGFPRALRSAVQMVFQDPYSSLNPRQRAWQSVAEAVRVWRGGAAAEARAEALRLLGSMGVNSEQAQHLPRSLSGGQRQRVSVARALAPGPRVLVADEPTSSIDQSAQAQLLNLLRQLQRDRGLAVVFISHDLGIIRYLTSRVYVMRKGVVVEDGPTAAVFDAPRDPYTRLLIDSIPGRRAAAQA